MCLGSGPTFGVLWREGVWWGVRLEAGDSQEPGGDGAQAPYWEALGNSLVASTW